jgi:hypothetical protein
MQMIELTFGYINWRGESSRRRARPISIRWGETRWHPRPGWLLLAFDLDKQENREFYMRDMLLVEPGDSMSLMITLTSG